MSSGNSAAISSSSPNWKNRDIYCLTARHLRSSDACVACRSKNLRCTIYVQFKYLTISLPLLPPIRGRVWGEGLLSQHFFTFHFSLFIFTFETASRARPLGRLRRASEQEPANRSLHFSFFISAFCFCEKQRGPFTFLIFHFSLFTFHFCFLLLRKAERASPLICRDFPPTV